MTRPKLKGQCCGNCKWLKVNDYDLTDHKPPRFQSNLVAKCQWPELALALSITEHFGFGTRMGRSFMSPVYTGCPVWEKYEEKE